MHNCPHRELVKEFLKLMRNMVTQGEAEIKKLRFYQIGQRTMLLCMVECSRRLSTILYENLVHLDMQLEEALMRQRREQGDLPPQGPIN